MLASFRRQLVLRHVFRLAVTGWVVFVVSAAMALCVGVLLPWLLFDVQSVIGWVFAAVFSITCGLSASIRQRTAMPTKHESAVAAEGRMQQSEGVIASAIADDSVFHSEIERQAEFALNEAMTRPAPALLTVKQVIAAPLLTFLLALLLVPLVGLESKTLVEDTAETPETSDTRNNWNAIDTASERSAADAAAVAKAKGMKESATSLREDAEAMRNAKTTDDAQRALDSARRSVPQNTNSDELPEIAPDDAKEREKLARKIESIADGLSARASELTAENGTKGTKDSGNEVVAQPDETPSNMVKMPVYKRQPMKVKPLAGMTIERRELAARAIKALEEQE
ncbi:MAG: hypothetical protein ACYTDT_13760 [Planctomycetota bacterium]|jgi:hypothetical protein